VLNRSHLANANLAGCDLTVRFAEGASLRNATLGGAVMFPAQLRAGNPGGANLTGARCVGDLPQTNLENAALAKMGGAADVKNQSRGLICANVVSVNLRGADPPGAELSRAGWRSSELSGAHPSGSKFIDPNFSGAKSRGADFTAATFRKVKRLAAASTQGARGLPAARQ
jgi:hypothetical protein